MLSSFIWSFPRVFEPNGKDGFVTPNGGAGVEEIEGAVVPDEVNGDTGADDEEPNVKGEVLEPEVDNPNENPVDGKVLEVDAEAEKDDVDD